MAHTQVSNTFVGVPKVNGGIWRLPQNIALPTDPFSARPAGAIRLGGVSDDGYTYMSERAIDKKKDWNGDKVRSVQTSKDDTFEITYIEFLSATVMAEVYGSANVTVTPATTSHGTIVAARSVADVLDHAAYIIDTFDGTVKKRRCIPDAQVTKIDPVAEKPGDWSVYKVTYDLFPDSQGVTNYSYHELGDKITPTEWTVTLVDATGGTFTLNVNGGTPTSGLAYNAASTAIVTALEALTEVGSGNATVTGSAGGPYTVTLSQGGTLGGNGSLLTPGGASITVVAV
jgi:hypothetical protein